MRKQGLIFGVLLILVLSLPALGLCQNKAMLWDGNQWKDLPQKAKIGYVKGVGNLADYEMATSGERTGLVARALGDEWRNKNINQIVQEVDNFYLANPQKLAIPVIEVMIRCCSGLAIP
jgi:hypothetical protein